MTKYHAKRVRLDGHWFDSQAEMRRYCDLKNLERAGQITELKVHPLYPLTAHGVTIGNYEADYSYRENGRLIVEDTKAIQTDIFRWKRKHFEAEYKGCEFRLHNVHNGANARWTEADMKRINRIGA